MNNSKTLKNFSWHSAAALIFAALFVSTAMTVATHAAGDLDFTFGNDGKVVTDFSGIQSDDYARDMAVQADGKVVLVGFAGGAYYDFALVRYNTNGSLDSSFGTDGKVTTDFIGGIDVANGVAIQSDGKIIAVGSANPAQGGLRDYAVARYDSNGSLDPTFGTGGKVMTDLLGSSDYAQAVAIQPDNKIVVAGYAWAGSNNDFVLARYNSDGSLDTTFDVDGKVASSLGGDDTLSSLALYTDGRILVAGSSTSDFILVRYNSNGSFDTSFDTDGVVRTDFGLGLPDGANAVAIQPDNKIVAAGFTFVRYPPPAINSDGAFALARYNNDGSLDNTFDGDGKTVTNFSSISLSLPCCTSDGEYIYDMAITADGKILAAGFTTLHDFTLSRYLSNGSLDTDFGYRGRLFSHLSPTYSRAIAVAIQTDGRILAAGYGTTSQIYNAGLDFILARYEANPKPIPVRSDFDLDAKSDIAVFRPSEGTWYVLNTSDNSFHSQQFGTPTDRPVPGYYDGDGKADIAVFRDNIATWYIMESSTNTMRTQVWGLSGDLPIQADYDGDGKFDIAIFRPSNGTWYMLKSFDNSFFYRTWGVAGDRPVPADYNGDFKNDIAVWRPSNGTWYILALPNTEARSIAFGSSGDTPVAAAYLP